MGGSCYQTDEEKQGLALITNAFRGITVLARKTISENDILWKEKEALKYRILVKSLKEDKNQEKLDNIEVGVYENNLAIKSELVPLAKDTNEHVKKGSNFDRYNFPPKIVETAEKIITAKYESSHPMCLMCEIEKAIALHHPCGRHRNTLDCCIFVCKKCHTLVDNDARENNALQAKWFNVIDWYNDPERFSLQ